MMIHKRSWIIFLITFIIAAYINHNILPDRKIPDDLPRIIEGNLTYIDLNRAELEKSVQESIDSGRLDEMFWKIIYLGSGRDKICFQKDREPLNVDVKVNNDLGIFYELKNKICFNISPHKNKTTYNLKYDISFILPSIKSGQIVNKSECIPETINESIKENCVINGEPVICHPCYTAPVRIELSYPKIETYFEANLYHKFIKFLFVFILTLILVKELAESLNFLIKR